MQRGLRSSPPEMKELAGKEDPQNRGRAPAEEKEAAGVLDGKKDNRWGWLTSLWR